MFLFSEIGDRSPARAALDAGQWQLTVRRLRGAYFDCPIGVPPELVVVEPAPLRPVEALPAALAVHPVVARTPWILVLDAERAHLAPRLPCHDFVVRGFAAAELLARADRLLKTPVRREAVLRSGAVAVDLASHTAKIGDLPVRLKPQEFALLRFFLQSPSRALTREALLQAVWGPDYAGGERTVDVHVRRLRAQLGGAAAHLETLREVGYRWVPEI